MTGMGGTSWLNEVKRLKDDNVRQQFADIEIQYFCVDNGCNSDLPTSDEYDRWIRGLAQLFQLALGEPCDEV